MLTAIIIFLHRWLNFDTRSEKNVASGFCIITCSAVSAHFFDTETGYLEAISEWDKWILVLGTGIEPARDD